MGLGAVMIVRCCCFVYDTCVIAMSMCLGYGCLFTGFPMSLWSLLVAPFDLWIWLKGDVGRARGEFVAWSFRGSFPMPLTCLCDCFAYSLIESPWCVHLATLSRLDDAFLMPRVYLHLEMLSCLADACLLTHVAIVHIIGLGAHRVVFTLR
jgi:hypothetical protein